MINVVEISAHRLLRNQPPHQQDVMNQPTQSISVYQSAAFANIDGANFGDNISFADDLVLDDVYQINPAANLLRLSIHIGAKGRGFTIADDTSTGHPGHVVHLDSTLTIMSPDGKTTEVILLVEVDKDGNVAEIFTLPLSPMKPKVAYAIVGIDTQNTRLKFAETACVSFARGTHITLSSGAQRKIEDLQAGDQVLTRDDGVQTIRWVGQNTVRAVGDYAPIVIAKGTLNNSDDLVLRPDHRLFIYQRSDALGTGRAELLVKARHLVNGDTVIQREGGFIDYFQLLFDAHQIIYAEGIAAESTLINLRTSAALPDGLREKLTQGQHDQSAQMHQDFEVSERLLDRPNAVEVLRRASTR